MSATIKEIKDSDFGNSIKSGLVQVDLQFSCCGTFRM